jgi:hypothetical protein
MGAGRGEPLAVRTLRPGGGGIGAGSGEPLALSEAKPGGGGIGAGSGEPLAFKATNPGGGGIGAGKGEPLGPSAREPGGGGIGAGSGEPLRRKFETKAVWLLNNCLTEPSTGSTIKTAEANRASRIDIFFIRLNPPGSTLKWIWWN